MKHLAHCGLAALALAAPALADGFDRTRVPAGVRAVAHVDVEALVQSQLVQELQRIEPDFDLDVDLGEQMPMLKGVKPLHDLRSVTVFAVDARKHRVGAVVRMSEKADALLQVAMGLDPYESMELGGHAVHSWSERYGEGERVYASVFPLPGSSDRLVLVANDAGLMGQGIAVLSGRAPSLATTKAGLLATQAQPGTILFAATDQTLSELGEIDPSSSVARLVQGMVLQLGEARGQVFAYLALQAESPQDVKRVHDVLQGATALASMVAEDAEHGAVLQRLTGALKYQTVGSQLFVEFSYGLQALIDDLRSLQEHEDH